MAEFQCLMKCGHRLVTSAAGERGWRAARGRVGPSAAAVAAFTVSGLFHEYMWLMLNWFDMKYMPGRLRATRQPPPRTWWRGWHTAPPCVGQV